jgi:hypothetical protein
MKLLLSLCVAVTSVFTPSKDPNMNGEYRTSPTPNAPGKFPTNFSDFPGEGCVIVNTSVSGCIFFFLPGPAPDCFFWPGGVEYFDVYHGPITSLYSQVWWTSTSNDLPPEIVKRFAGKTMAIVGIEMDQVRKTPNGDVSLPITHAYNHHHDTAVVGKGTEFEEVAYDDPRMARVGRNFIRLDKVPNDLGVQMHSH